MTQTTPLLGAQKIIALVSAGLATSTKAPMGAAADPPTSGEPLYPINKHLAVARKTLPGKLPLPGNRGYLENNRLLTWKFGQNEHGGAKTQPRLPSNLGYLEELSSQPLNFLTEFP